MRNNPSAVIVLSEVYGITSSVRLSCDTLHAAGFDAIAPDYFRLPGTYAVTEEKTAYDTFLSFGFDRASGNVREFLEKIRPHYRKIFLAGFSAGATTAWLCASGETLCDGIAAVYGSRIRNYATLKPEVPSLLIFPRQEPAFDVRELCGTLSSSPLVSARIYEGNHGFADQRSACYHEDSWSKAHEEIAGFFRKIQ